MDVIPSTIGSLFGIKRILDTDQDNDGNLAMIGRSVSSGVVSVVIDKDQQIKFSQEHSDYSNYQAQISFDSKGERLAVCYRVSEV